MSTLRLLLRDLGLAAAHHALNQLAKPDSEHDERVAGSIETRLVNGVYVPTLEPTP